MKNILFYSVAASLISTNSFAVDNEFNNSLAVSKIQYNEITGYGLEVGWTKPKDFYVLDASLGVFRYKAQTIAPYREETFINGQTICRDTRSGQFANEENCNSQKTTSFATLSFGKELHNVKIGAGTFVTFEEGVDFYIYGSTSITNTLSIMYRKSTIANSLSIVLNF